MPTKKKTPTKKKLTKAEIAARAQERARTKMRIAICKDVLKLIAPQSKRKITVEQSNGFMVMPGKVPHKTEQAAKKIKNCTVCALGSMMLADIDRNNHLTFAQLARLQDEKWSGFSDVPRSAAVGRLKKFFTVDELDAIESVFEDSPYDLRFNADIDEDPKPVCTPALMKVADRSFNADVQRLRAMMNAIIKDRGKVLSDEYQAFLASSRR